jgi:hypothetical protein
LTETQGADEKTFYFSSKTPQLNARQAHQKFVAFTI